MSNDYFHGRLMIQQMTITYISDLQFCVTFEWHIGPCLDIGIGLRVYLSTYIAFMAAYNKKNRRTTFFSEFI